MKYSFKNGDNKYTCDGKIMALSREFINYLEKSKKDMFIGNVDITFYFACITGGFTYKNVKSAKVLYKNPDNVKDYIRWITRNEQSTPQMTEHFGKIVTHEQDKPKMIFLYSLL